MDVEVQEDGLPAAREGVLRAAEDESLRDLADFGGVHAAEVGGVHDVDVREAERARVVGLHGRDEGVQVRRQHVRAVGGGALVVEVVEAAQAVLLDVLDGVGGAVDAVRVAEVVEVDRARVVRRLQVLREDRVQRPLLEHQLRDAQLHRLGIVVDDVAVLLALGVHQAVDELARDAVHREVAQLVAVATEGKLVVQQLAYEVAVDAVDAARDDLVLDRLRDVEGDFLVEVRVAAEGVDQLLAVPGHRVALVGGLDEQEAGVGQVHGLAVAGAGAALADADALAGELAVLAVALVGGDDGGVPLLGQHDLDEVLHVLDARDLAAFRVGRDEVLALGVEQLRDDQVRQLLRHVRADLHVVAARDFLRRAGNRLHDLVAPERHHHPVALHEAVEHLHRLPVHHRAHVVFSFACLKSQHRRAPVLPRGEPGGAATGACIGFSGLPLNAHFPLDAKKPTHHHMMWL